MTDVLILDGEQRAALAATRSLGRLGLDVAVCSATDRSISSSSRYCSRAVRTADPAQDADAFIDGLEDGIGRLDPKFVLPITDASMSLVLEREGEFDYRLLAAPSRRQYSTLSDKVRLLELAEKLNIRCPKSVRSTEPEFQDIDRLRLEFPVIIKPSLSRIRTDTGLLATRVTRALSAEDFATQFESLAWLKLAPFLVQEIVDGSGVGIFLLCENGVIRAAFCHRRLRQKPPEGGVSVYCESIPLHDEAFAATARLIESTGWNGPLMAEFIVDSDGSAYLIEVNGRFWGSLALSIAAGVDFPALAYRMETGDNGRYPDSYDEDVRMRWLLGDLDSLYLQFRRQDISAGAKLASAGAFVRDFFRNNHHAVFDLSDLAPFSTELRAYFAALRRNEA